MLSRALCPVPDDADSDSPVLSDGDLDSAVVYDSDSDPDSDSDAAADICANNDLPVSGLERAAWGGRICVVGGRYRLAMSPSLRHYVDCMKAVQRFKASGGLLPLNLRLSRARRQLRFPTRLARVVHGTVCGGDVGAEPAAGGETGDAGAHPGTGAVTCVAGAESEAGAVIGAAGTESVAGDATDAGTDPGMADAPSDSETKLGMGCMIGAEGKTPMQVCEISRLTAARGVSFASTFGQLSLILPGASLPRLAGKQADLLHKINC